MALAALKSVGNQLYGWDKEPDLQSMKLARHGGDVPTAAVNLALINTSPQQLAEMAKAKSDLDDDHLDDHVDDDRSGPSSTECNAQGMGPSVVAPQQPSAATHGPPIPKKETPKPPPERQPAVAPPAGHSPVSEKSQQPPPEDSFERARAEHRKANWEKYRQNYR